MEKLEWCRYPMVKNVEDIFIHFDVIHERDGQTDGQTDRHCVTAKTALASHRAVKLALTRTSDPNRPRAEILPRDAMRLTFCIEAIQKRSVARPLCDSRASCHISTNR